MAFKYYRCIDSSSWQSSVNIQINSKNIRKLKSFVSNSSQIIFEENIDLYHMFRADKTNCGDWWSLPAHYFTFPSESQVVEINDYTNEQLKSGSIIIGGGRLIGPAFKQLEFLLAQKNIKKIGWGLGNNMLDNKKTGYVSHSVPFPKYVENFDLLGVRDYIHGYRWVPCASCMHPAFSKKYEIKHDIVIFEHKRIPINIKGFPKLNNTGNDIEKILSFLGSAETVITNSYHGAYWAILLGRKCIVFHFSSKFYGFKHKPSIGQIHEWRSLLDKATVHKEALYESKEANIKFYNDVMKLLM